MSSEEENHHDVISGSRLDQNGTPEYLLEGDDYPSVWVDKPFLRQFYPDTWAEYKQSISTVPPGVRIVKD